MSPSKLTVEVWPATHPGQAEVNEDTVLIYQPEDPNMLRLQGSMYVLADGLGGASRGQQASRYAAQRVIQSYYSNEEPDLGLRLREAVEVANSELFAYAKERPELVKLGTTIVAAVIRGEQMHIAAVGDSRAYMIREGEIEQITRDHTLVQQLLDEGAIKPEEAAEHPRRDVVLRTLGAEETVKVDVYDLRLGPDDVLVLSSDGLTRYMDDDQINDIVATRSPKVAAELLVETVNRKGGKDNISVITALLRDGAPSLVTDLPHTWDGSIPSFEEQQTLAMKPVQPAAPAPPTVETQLPTATDEFDPRAATQTIAAPVELPPQQPPAQPAGDQGWLDAPTGEEAGAETIRANVADLQLDQLPPQQPPAQPAPPVQQAPPYQAQVQPAPQASGQPPAGVQPPAPQQVPPQQPPATPQEEAQYPPRYGPGIPRGFQPPAGYEYDPVTGLAPMPMDGPAQPGSYQGQPYQPPPGGGAPLRQRRGISLGTFLLFGLLAILLTVGMIFVLVNPFDWSLESVGDLFSGGGDEATAEVVETPVVDVQPTVPAEVPPEVVEPTSTSEPALVAPPGMVLIAEGSFFRGADPAEVDETTLQCIREAEDNRLCNPEFFTDAQPVQEITLSDYFIDVTEVTNIDYATCVATEICDPPTNQTFYADPNFAQHPVSYVTYDMAVTYCRWAGKRLPTEAEWEKAARYDAISGSGYWFPWGNNYDPGRANTLAAGLNGTSAAGAFAQDRSPLGMLDMAGNVSEWVSDWYFEYGTQGTIDPLGPASQPYSEALRVARGGSFESIEAYARAAHRLSVLESSGAPWLGFRCAGSGDNPPPAAAPAADTPPVEPTAILEGEATPEGEVATEGDAVPTVEATPTVEPTRTP